MQAFGADVIRIKIKKTDGYSEPEYRKFSVDPELTSFDVLRTLLAKAFDIKTDFTISYLANNNLGDDIFIPILSDWDVDAAFATTAKQPDGCLRLKVELKAYDSALDDWDIVGPRDVHQPPAQVVSAALSTAAAAQAQSPLPPKGGFFSSLNQAFSKMHNAFSKRQSISEPNPMTLKKPPLSDDEFKTFLDAEGRLVKHKEFHQSVFFGGIESGLRTIAWRNLLNVFPEGLTGRERYEYMQEKCRDYYALRTEWQDELCKSGGNEEIRSIVSTVKKDVLRTDRNHPFYAGDDDNRNLVALLNLLVTFAITHPDVSYCQGMSDLASPVLMVQQDEAQAYVCFCGLMKERWRNFTVDGLNMSTKFRHLGLLLRRYDPQFYLYLKSVDADDLFFCFRWLLLELKREFPLDHVLLVLEVQWAAMSPKFPDRKSGGLRLTSEGYSIDRYQAAASLLSQKSPSLRHSNETVYTRLQAEMCRQYHSPRTRAAPRYLSYRDPVNAWMSAAHGPGHRSANPKQTAFSYSAGDKRLNQCTCGSNATKAKPLERIQDETEANSRASSVAGGSLRSRGRDDEIVPDRGASNLDTAESATAKHGATTSNIGEQQKAPSESVASESRPSLAATSETPHPSTQFTPIPLNRSPSIDSSVAELQTMQPENRSGDTSDSSNGRLLLTPNEEDKFLEDSVDYVALDNIESEELKRRDTDLKKALQNIYIGSPTSCEQLTIDTGAVQDGINATVIGEAAPPAAGLTVTESAHQHEHNPVVPSTLVGQHSCGAKNCESAERQKEILSPHRLQSCLSSQTICAYSMDRLSGSTNSYSTPHDSFRLSTKSSLLSTSGPTSTSATRNNSSSHFFIAPQKSIEEAAVSDTDASLILEKVSNQQLLVDEVENVQEEEDEVRELGGARRRSAQWYISGEEGQVDAGEEVAAKEHSQPKPVKTHRSSTHATNALQRSNDLTGLPDKNRALSLSQEIEQLLSEDAVMLADAQSTAAGSEINPVTNHFAQTPNFLMRSPEARHISRPIVAAQRRRDDAEAAAVPHETDDFMPGTAPKESHLREVPMFRLDSVPDAQPQQQPQQQQQTNNSNSERSPQTDAIVPALLSPTAAVLPRRGGRPPSSVAPEKCAACKEIEQATNVKACPLPLMHSTQSAASLHVFGLAESETTPTDSGYPSQLSDHILHDCGPRSTLLVSHKSQPLLCTKVPTPEFFDSAADEFEDETEENLESRNRRIRLISETLLQESMKCGTSVEEPPPPKLRSHSGDSCLHSFLSSCDVCADNNEVECIFAGSKGARKVAAGRSEAAHTHRLDSIESRKSAVGTANEGRSETNDRKRARVARASAASSGGRSKANSSRQSPTSHVPSIDSGFVHQSIDKYTASTSGLATPSSSRAERGSPMIEDTEYAEDVLASLHEAADEFGENVEIPPPDELGVNTPFLIFLCLTLFLQHRDIIMKNHMDYNELAMFFDRKVRKHDVRVVLLRAQHLYEDYLRIVSVRELVDSSDSEKSDVGVSNRSLLQVTSEQPRFTHARRLKETR